MIKNKPFKFSYLRLNGVKMLIAISQRNEKNEFGNYKDSLENNYINYYESFGIKLIPIPNSSKDIKKYFEELPIKGIILTGGGDVNPRLYNQEPTYTTNYSELRDNTEKTLLEIALEKNLPVFCNCRGTQFMNVFFGGNLIQSIKNRFNVNHVATKHPIKIVDENISKFFGGKRFIVNSFHDQGFTKENLSKELKDFAVSEKDSIIEGIYHPRYPIAGILWHPERLNSDKEFDKKVVKAFIERKLFWQK